MTQEIPPPHIATEASPRDLLAEHFQSMGGPLPVRGGWGYTQESAVIIDRNDPIVDQQEPFNGVAIEHVFVEKRIYEELIVQRPEEDRFSGISWELQKQILVTEDNRKFDVLEFEVTAFRDADWERLKADWEGPSGFQSPEFDEAAHFSLRETLQIRYVATFWFDITSFFGLIDNITDSELDELLAGLDSGDAT